MAYYFDILSALSMAEVAVAPERTREDIGVRRDPVLSSRVRAGGSDRESSPNHRSRDFPRNGARSHITL